MHKNPHSCDRTPSFFETQSSCSSSAGAAQQPLPKICNEVNLNPPNSVATISPSPSPMIMLAAASSSSTWLRARRSRYFFLILCSPILIPFLCATFPFLCAAELGLRLCRRRRMKTACGDGDEAEEAERLRRCEEGRSSGCGEAGEVKEGMGLLQRYLEDQLKLVGSVYDCGDDDDDEYLYNEIHDYDNDTYTTPLLA